MKILKSLPLRFWPLDQSNLNDYSGQGVVATRSGTERVGVGLCSYVKHSQFIDSTRSITYTAPVYLNNKKNKSFSMGATFYPILNNFARLVSKSANNDGLYYDGTSIQFTTKYATTGEARCSYTPGRIEKYDVVGVHTPVRNSLYVNGLLVAEVDITEAQQADEYHNDVTNFYSNTGASKFLINSVFIVGRQLSGEEIMNNYNYSNTRHEGDVAAPIGGDTLSFSHTFRNPYLDFEFDTEEEWLMGTMENCEIINEVLTSTLSEGTTTDGYWLYTVDLTNYEQTTVVDSISLDWSGKNVAVDVSYDDGAWTSVTPRTNISVVPPGTDVTDKILVLRLSFTNGQPEAYVKTLRLRANIGNVLQLPEERPVTMNNVVNLEEHSPLTLRDNWGAKVYTSLAFGADPTSPPMDPRTIEVWIKKSGTLTTSFSPTTTYVNSVAGGTFDDEEWALVHYVLPATVSTFTLTGSFQIGKVSLYPGVLTASQVTKVYLDYVGTNIEPVQASEVINITETSAEPDTYAYDWTVSSSE